MKKNPAAIASAVEHDIAEGRLAPGERIDEVVLAGRFKVSRTPVREALRQLAATGMVEHRANRGAFVAEVTLEDVFDVYEVLAELEGLCAALAARRMTEAERRELGSLHERMGKLLAARHRERYIELDEKLHCLLVQAARNSALQDTSPPACGASPPCAASAWKRCTTCLGRTPSTSCWLALSRRATVLRRAGS